MRVLRTRAQTGDTGHVHAVTQKVGLSRFGEVLKRFRYLAINLTRTKWSFYYLKYHNSGLISKEELERKTE